MGLCLAACEPDLVETAGPFITAVPGKSMEKTKLNSRSDKRLQHGGVTKWTLATARKFVTAGAGLSHKTNLP